MKTSNKLLLGLLAVIVFVITATMITARIKLGDKPGFGHVSSAGDIKEQRNVEIFNRIEIHGRIRVDYTQGSPQSVVVKDDSSMVKLVVSEVKDGILYLSTREDIDRDEPIQVNITADSIVGLKLTDGGVFATTQKMKVAVMKAEASQGAVFNIDGDFRSLVFDINSGCVVNLKGVSEHLKIDCSAGCVINSGDMAAKTGDISANAGAVLNVNVTDEISVDANAGSVIRCAGKPKVKSINVSSGAQFVN